MRYRIHEPLDNYEGAKTGRRYTCTRDALFDAPEGEFKDLPRSAYSRAPVPAGGSPGEGEGGAPQTQGAPAALEDDEDDSTSDDASSSST